MKSLKQFLAAVVLGGSMMSSAFAVEPIPHTQFMSMPGGIEVYNESYWEDFTVYTISYPSGAEATTYLAPGGQLYYPILYGDNEICFHVDSNYNGDEVFTGCGSFGDELEIDGSDYLAAIDKSAVQKTVGKLIKAKK